MRGRITGICRGSGKVYVQLKVDEPIALCNNLALRAATSDGQLIPCSLYFDEVTPEGESTFVAVLPDLSVRSCALTLEMVSPTGMRTPLQDIELDFRVAKWLSRVNYRLSEGVCNRIRDYDDRYVGERGKLTFVSCIPDGDEAILRIEVDTPNLVDNFCIRVLGSDLSPLSIEPISLGESIKKPSLAGMKSRRTILASVRIPADMQRLVFTVRFSDMERPTESDLSNVLDRPVFEELRARTSASFENAQCNPRYDGWLRSHLPTAEQLRAQSALGSEWGPSFSILTPLYNTPLELFKDMVVSVLNQTYDRWELILINASPENEELSSVAREYARKDERVKLLTLERNEGISGNTRAGFEACRGDFVCFLDHDDFLAPEALFEYAQTVSRNEKVDLLYSDEDKYTEDGHYVEPFFKPDFEIDLLRSANYVCHFLCMRRELALECYPSDSQYDGAQDYYLILRASESARNIIHVPKVLYHWRMGATSTSGNRYQKDYASEAGVKALSSHLERLGIDATVTKGPRPTTYVVRYAPPSDKPLVSIIIPSKDCSSALMTCVSSIFDKTTYDNFEIVIVENNSVEEQTFACYETLTSKHPGVVRVVEWHDEFNFSKVVNYGAMHAHGEYLLLLNNDTEVITPGWLTTMLGVCAREDVGAVGAHLYYPDNTTQHAGITVNGLGAHHIGLNIPRGQVGYFELMTHTQDFSAVTAACLMTKRRVFDEVGGFSEAFTVAYNDVDYCLKLRDKNLLVAYCPDVELYHYESLSRGFEDTLEKKLRFRSEMAQLQMKWPRYFVLGDPYMNVNLTPNNGYYQLG